MGNRLKSKELSVMPAKVALAVKILYLVIGIGIIRTIMTVDRLFS
jgi:hypothetical protein